MPHRRYAQMHMRLRPGIEFCYFIPAGAFKINSWPGSGIIVICTGIRAEIICQDSFIIAWHDFCSIRLHVSMAYKDRTIKAAILQKRRI